MVSKTLDEEVKAVLALFDAVESSEIPEIDGKTIACALKLVFYAGVEKQEISSIKIRDLQWKDGLPIGIDPGSLAIAKKFIHLPVAAQKIVSNYLKHLSSKSAPVKTDLAFFPEYAGASGLKKFDRHVKKLQEALRFSESLQFNALHKLGVKHHENLDKEGQTERPTALQFRIKDRSVQAVITGNIQPAGKKRTIAEEMNKISDYLQKIEWSNDQYTSFMKDFVKQKNELVESFHKEKSIDLGIMQRLKEKNIEVIRGLEKLYGSDLKLRSLSPKNTSPSRILFMVKAEDQWEKIEKLMWALDYIPIIPISDLQELNIFKDLFFETLSSLVLDLRSSGEMEDAKKAQEVFPRSFLDGFYRRDVVFAHRSSTVYAWQKPNPSTPPEDLVAMILKSPMKDELGAPDNDLISMLKNHSNEDLKPLFSYLAIVNDNFSFCQYHVSDYASRAEDIVKEIQRVSKDDTPFQGITKLVTYKETLYYVANTLGAKCGVDKSVEHLETQINSRILEDLWANLSIETQEALCGLQANEMNCLLARAFWKEHSGTDLVSDRSVQPIHWTATMEDEICRELKNWISHQRDLSPSDFLAVLRCIAHMSLLRQLKPNKTKTKYPLELVYSVVDGQRLPIYVRVPKQVTWEAPSADPARLPMIV